jgi:hypothetical protein
LACLQVDYVKMRGRVSAGDRVIKEFDGRKPPEAWGGRVLAGCEDALGRDVVVHILTLAQAVKSNDVLQATGLARHLPEDTEA